MRIAIIGAGVSGLVCAELLSHYHDVTLFEAQESAGGHANTVIVELDDGQVAVDTGFIVFNDHNYQHFERLLERFGVARRLSDMCFSVSDGRGFEYSGASLNGLFAQRRNLLRPAFHGMIRDLLRFNRQARMLLDGEDDISLRDWLEVGGYSRWFCERLIVPQVSAVWSADPASLWDFPARTVSTFFDRHGMLGLLGRPKWWTIEGGSRRYVDALSSALEGRVRLASPVRSIARNGDSVSVQVEHEQPQLFDAVVIGTHSDQALRMLSDPSGSEQEILGAIAYLENEAVLHTDESLLPGRRRAWASWNYHLLDRQSAAPAVTYHMNRLQQLTASQQLCVTLNRTQQIDPAKVIASFRYAHPVFTQAGIRAQSRHPEISGVNRTYYCGAYWGYGFHEDGVNSAKRVAEQLGAKWI